MMLIFIAAIIAIYIFHILLWHETINKQNPAICDYESFQTSPTFEELYAVYAYTRICIAGFIDIWIASMTIMTLYLMHRETGLTYKKSFRAEMCRIKLIYWTFVLTYSLSLFYAIAIVIYPEMLSKQRQFVDDILDMSIMMVLDLVPILIVAIAHFTSYSSVGRLLKIVRTLKLQEMTMD